MRDNERRTRTFAKQMRRNLTAAEAIMWNALRKIKAKGVVFRRQHTIGYYIADFACVALRLVIEVDGATHSTDIEVANDNKRSEFLRNDGWEIIRVWNSDVYKNLSGVIHFIESRVVELNSLRLLDPCPPPSALRAATSSVNGARINPPPLAEEGDQTKFGGGGSCA